MAFTRNADTPVAFESRQSLLIALQIVFVVVALVVYILRLYTRAHILRSTGHDDQIMGLAIVFSVAMGINACICTRYGLGEHIEEVPASDSEPFLLHIWISEFLFSVTASLVKISILFFYLRIAVTTTFRRIVYGSIAFIFAWAIAFSAVVIFQCRPISAYWHAASAQCAKPQAALFIHGLTNTVTDIYIFVLPMQMVWKTQLPQRQRIGLLVIFSTGFLVCVAGVLRLYYSITAQDSKDTTWDSFNLWTWGSIEINLGIVCASAPCLKALVARLAPKLMASHNVNSISQKPAARYHLETRRNARTQYEYGLGSMGELRRDKNQVQLSGDSQESLTKVDDVVAIAAVDVDRIV